MNFRALLCYSKLKKTNDIFHLINVKIQPELKHSATGSQQENLSSPTSFLVTSTRILSTSLLPPAPSCFPLETEEIT